MKTDLHHSPMKWLLVAAIGLSAMWLWSKQTSTAPSQQLAESSAPPPSSAPPAILAAIEAAKAYHLRCLELVAKGDHEGDAAIDFYRSRAFYGAITGRDTISLNPLETKEKDVMIIVASQEERRANNIPSAANWQYLEETRTVYAPRIEDYSEPWTGIRLAHELSHTIRYVTGAMPHKPSDLEMQREEIRANRFELRLIDRFTKGAYQRTLDTWIEDQHPQPHAPDEWFRAPDEPLYQRLKPLFPPPKSVHEEASRRGSLLVSMNIRLATKQGVDDEMLARAINPEAFHLR